mgnify:CR=1 FL=1
MHARDLYMQSKHRKGVGHGRSTSVFVLSRARTRTQPARAHQRRSGPRHPHADPHASVERLFLAKAAAVVLLVVSLVGFARIGLMSATISTTMQSSQLTSQISDARSSGAALEVSQSTLSNPTKVKQQAGKAGHGRPRDHGVITLDKDVVATDESGALSLSKSVARAAGSEA